MTLQPQLLPIYLPHRVYASCILCLVLLSFESSQLVSDREFLETSYESKDTNVATWLWGGS